MKAFIQIILFVLLIVLVAGFNAGLIDVRIGEISYFLDRISGSEDMSKTLGIVGKYELIKRRMQYGEDNMVNYELEARVQAVTSGEQVAKEVVPLYKRIYQLPMIGLLNGVRLAMGKEIIKARTNDKLLDILEIGYFWERNRKYNEAIAIYNQVLAMPSLNKDLRAAVMIHKAFCHSMLSQYDASKQIYENVITDFPNTEAGMLSWKLLDFIQSMEKERESIGKQILSDLEKAKQFYWLMDYRNAIKFFSTFIESNSTPEFLVEARFFKGRSHEELGETEEAIDEYRRVIADDKTGTWAKQANRRLIMLGEFYSQKKLVADEARKKLAEYQDVAFMNQVDHYASMVTESSLRNELLKDTKIKMEKGGSVDSSVMALLNGLDDLSGEKAQAKINEEQRLREQIEASGMAKGDVAAMAEVKRIQTLQTDPMRRPGVIQNVINNNADELKYLYNKRLRKGVKIAGHIEVQMIITPSGSISTAQISQSNMGDREFENEVARQVRTWRFQPVADSLGDLKLTFPFDFMEDE